MPELRTSTMTHIVWCPPEWHAKAKVTLAGLAERHPARTIFLIPEPGRKAGIVARAELKGFQLPGMAHEVISEVIQIRLRGRAADHPGSVVTPLARLRSARLLPLARGAKLGKRRPLRDPRRHGQARRRLLGVAEGSRRLRRPGVAVRARRRLRHRLLAHAPLAPSSRGSLAGDRFDLEASDPGTTRGCRAGRRLASIEAEARDLADAAGCRGRRGDLGRWRTGRLGGRVLSPSELLSGELDQFGRDPVYEAAVASVRCRRPVPLR